MIDETNDMTRGRMDAEKLAALIDGRVSDDERAALLRRIASSEDDLDVLMDAAGAVGDLNASEIPSQDAGAVVLPIAARSRKRWRALAYTGITAAAAAAVILMVRKSDSPRLLAGGSPRLLTAELSDRSPLPSSWDFDPWIARRGEANVDEQRSYVRVGVRAVDLELAMAGRDSSVPRLASDMEAILQNIPSGTAVGSLFRQIAETRDSSSGQAMRPAVYSAAFEPVQKALRSLPKQDLVTLGALLETSRIAAVRNDREWFQSEAVRQTFERLGKSEMISLTDRRSVREMMNYLDDPTRIAKLSEAMLSRM